MVGNGGSRMSPQDARRLTAYLRSEVTRRIAAAMSMPAGVRRAPGVPIVCWLDPHGGLNHARLDPHMAPCPGELDCPLVLRVSINYLALDHHEAILRRMGWEARYRGRYGSAVGWSYELTALPGEVLNFVPWLVSLAVAQAERDESQLRATPYACYFWGKPGLTCHYAWTQAAWRATDAVRQRWQQEWRRRHGLLTQQCDTDPRAQNNI